jgi:hypothetical protein
MMHSKQQRVLLLAWEFMQPHMTFWRAMMNIKF